MNGQKRKAAYPYSIMVNGGTLSENGETIIYDGMTAAVEVARVYLVKGHRVLIHDESEHGYFSAYRLEVSTGPLPGLCLSPLTPDETAVEQEKDYDYGKGAIA